MQLEPGSAITGGWCPRCKMPSLLRVPVHMLSPWGVSLLEMVEACVEDGRVVSA
jgi:hypothetical protein